LLTISQYTFLIGHLGPLGHNDGVGSEDDCFKRILGGAIGLGLKQIILECYAFVVADYEAGDEIYLFGFPEAPTARASRFDQWPYGIFNTRNPNKERINERVHWSVIKKHEDQAGLSCAPRNLPVAIPAARIAAITSEERELLRACRS
jgi:hypothetical protein